MLRWSSSTEISTDVCKSNSTVGGSSVVRIDLAKIRWVWSYKSRIILSYPIQRQRGMVITATSPPSIEVGPGWAGLSPGVGEPVLQHQLIPEEWRTHSATASLFTWKIL